MPRIPTLRELTRSLLMLAKGLPADYPPLAFGTLDIDDVQLARYMLRNKADWYSEEPVRTFEKAFAEWNRSGYAFSFMGARVSLSAVVQALGLRAGDEVIVPGYTCIVVVNAFHYAGIETVYADIELDTFGLDVRSVQERITPNTRAILLHHLYGLVSRDLEALLQVARANGLFVIEDCAQSTGAEYQGTKVGNFGDAAIYSSEQSKVFNTIQGGMATTNDSEIASRLKFIHESAPYPAQELIEKQLNAIVLRYYLNRHRLRWLNGSWAKRRYGSGRFKTTTEEEVAGIKPVHYGCRMPAAIAVLGLNQLAKIDHYNQLRRETAARWDNWCNSRGYRQPTVIEGSRPVYLRYPILVEPEKKRDLSWAPGELGVRPGVWFQTQLHPSDRQVDGCPNAAIAVERCINLPGIIR